MPLRQGLFRVEAACYVVRPELVEGLSDARSGRSAPTGPSVSRLSMKPERGTGRLSNPPRPCRGPALTAWREPACRRPLRSGAGPDLQTSPTDSRNRRIASMWPSAEAIPDLIVFTEMCVAPASRQPRTSAAHSSSEWWPSATTFSSPMFDGSRPASRA